MPDTLTPEQRSERMSRVRAKNTGPELIVRRLVHSLGYCRDDCDRYGRETHPRLLRARALRLQDWRDLHELRAVSDVHGSDLLVEDAARLLFEHEGGRGQGRIRRRATSTPRSPCRRRRERFLQSASWTSGPRWRSTGGSEILRRFATEPSIASVMSLLIVVRK